MIDLHIHVLPGLDDGPTTREEALEMCRLAAADGTRTLVATPHVIPGVFDNRPERVLDSIRSLSDSLAEAGVELTILPGADVRLEHDLPERLARGEVGTINQGSYLLLELPETLSELGLMRSLSALKNGGFRPILSHPERSPYIQEKVDRLYDLVASGVLVQITGRSLTGGFGDDVQRFTERILSCRLAHILASDAHSAGTRPPGLQAACRRAAGLVGEEDALAMVQETPSRVLRGLPVATPVPLPWKPRKRPWWRFGG